MRHFKKFGERRFLRRRSLPDRLRINEIFSQTAQELGHNNEKRVVEAYTRNDDTAHNKEIPEWIQSVRLGTTEEDKLGVDVVFSTNIGSIFVQVKGCSLGIQNFKLKHQIKSRIRIIGIVVYPTHTPQTIRTALTPLLWKEYSRLLVERRPWNFH